MRPPSSNLLRTLPLLCRLDQLYRDLLDRTALLKSELSAALSACQTGTLSDHTAHSSASSLLRRCTSLFPWVHLRSRHQTATASPYCSPCLSRLCGFHRKDAG